MIKTFSVRFSQKIWRSRVIPHAFDPPNMVSNEWLSFDPPNKVSEYWPNCSYIWDAFFKEKNPYKIYSPVSDEYENLDDRALVKLVAIKKKLTKSEDFQEKIRKTLYKMKLKKTCNGSTQLEEFVKLPEDIRAALFDTASPLFNYGNLLIWCLFQEVNNQREIIRTTARKPLLKESWGPLPEAFSELISLSSELTPLLEATPEIKKVRKKSYKKITHKQVMLALYFVFSSQLSLFEYWDLEIEGYLTGRLVENYVEAHLGRLLLQDVLVSKLQIEAQLLKQILYDFRIRHDLLEK